MKEIKVSDSCYNEGGIEYLRFALKNALSDFGSDASVVSDGQRSVLKFGYDKDYGDYLRCEVEDKIAEVIAVKYKYDYFKKRIAASGLNETEKEILLCALISADIDDDRRYILRKLRHFSEYAIDGVFNFRLIPLKKKWEEIVGYVPPFFTRERLTDFVSYLTYEKQSKTVYFENGIVYDKHYNILNRTSLTGKKKECRIIREIILSGCGSVKKIGDMPEKDEEYLKEFFDGRINDLA